MKILNRLIIGALIYFGHKNMKIEFCVRKIKLIFWVKGLKIIKMGFKSLSKSNTTQYKVGGLIFSSKESYQDLKEIDNDVRNILSGFRSLEELPPFFNKIKTIEVIGTYDDAVEEMDGLFPNATYLLCYEGVENLILEYKFGCMFFSKIKYREQ